ncbi:MAG TPA: pyruvate dehydrogenase (acetyl-transferring) E1 component subunit alpha [Gemmatales bacterium]|nr:pyruvate dehydrogenase (acetyl-transferring) E1 component subunit alpha [Gemmatales bacterium]
MPRRALKNYTIEHLQIMDQDGNVDPELDPKIPDNDLKDLYRTMLKARMVDDRMYKLQAQGRMGTFPGVKGQEGCLGYGYALGKDDSIVPAFRETAALFYRGAPIKNILQYFMGMEEANVFPPEVKILPIPIAIGSQTLHGTGLAWANQIQDKPGVVLIFFGDGGSSEGDFHEACNMAGIFKLPVIFVCINNGWAISVPRRGQTASETIAQKALGYGFAGIQVDGNDFMATYVACKEALERARKGEGPTLIESVTYRLGAHTTADDPKRYRNEKEVEAWKPRDPLLRFKTYMEKKKLWTAAWQEQLEKELAVEIEDSVREAESEFTAINPYEMFDHVYAEMTPDLVAQKEQALEFADEVAAMQH